MEIILWKCGGPYYRTRDGRRAVVLESNMVLPAPPAPAENIWQGRVGPDWAEWRLDGTHRGKGGPDDPGLDLVEVWPTEPPPYHPPAEAP